MVSGPGTAPRLAVRSDAKLPEHQAAAALKKMQLPSIMEAKRAAKRKGNTPITSTAAVWSCSPVPGDEPVFRPEIPSASQRKRGENTSWESGAFITFCVEGAKDTRSKEIKILSLSACVVLDFHQEMKQRNKVS